MIGVKQLGFRTGNWLSTEQSSEVLKHACGSTMRAKRDYAMLAMLLGCGFRRSELVGLEVDEIQMRQGHWAVVDLIAKGGHIRTVPIPAWVKTALDQWTLAARVTEGRIFRGVARTGKVWGTGISQNVVWYVVRSCCGRAGLERIAPHDLRRTCAKLCHDSGGALEQIQFLLGHASVQTTERYLGCKQNLGHPVNDLFSLALGPQPARTLRWRELRESGGERGIRTLDTGVSPYNGLANSPVPPPGVRNQCFMFGELAQYSAGIAIFAHNCATSVQPGTDNQVNGIHGTTERILRPRLQKSNGRE